MGARRTGHLRHSILQACREPGMLASMAEAGWQRLLTSALKVQ